MLHGKRSWYDSCMLYKEISTGDLVRVTNGYTSRPSPMTGDLGIVLDLAASGPELFGTGDRMVFINGEPWRQNVQDLEVICDTGNGDNVSNDVCDNVCDASVSSKHQDIQE